MQIVIDIPDRIYKRQGYLNIIDSDILRNALKNGIPLPKGATNGDMIKAMFSEVEVTYNGFLVEVELEAFSFTVEESWWNAPYKEV